MKYRPHPIIIVYRKDSDDMTAFFWIVPLNPLTIHDRKDRLNNRLTHRTRHMKLVKRNNLRFFFNKSRHYSISRLTLTFHFRRFQVKELT